MRSSSARSGTRHSTQEHPFEVIIQYPHHPRAGEHVVALRRVLHGACLHFVIEQPDGTRILLPAWMTENSAATLPMVEIPRLSLDSLRGLRGLVDAQRISSSPSSRTSRTVGGDDERTMATTRSADPYGRGNPAPRARTESSLGSQQPAPASSQGMQRSARKSARGRP